MDTFAYFFLVVNFLPPASLSQQQVVIVFETPLAKVYCLMSPLYLPIIQHVLSLLVSKSLLCMLKAHGEVGSGGHPQT